MTATMSTGERAPIERTEHPHIVRSADTLGGEPRIEGTRISVRHVLMHYLDGGDSPESIADTYGLKLAHVLEALSYGLDHPDEMRYYDDKHRLRTILRDNDMIFVPEQVGGRLIPRARLATEPLGPGIVTYSWETLPSEYDR